MTDTLLGFCPSRVLPRLEKCRRFRTDYSLNLRARDRRSARWFTVFGALVTKAFVSSLARWPTLLGFFTSSVLWKRTYFCGPGLFFSPSRSSSRHRPCFPHLDPSPTTPQDFRPAALPEKPSVSVDLGPKPFVSLRPCDPVVE
jgi:hypothetical protein